MPGLILRTFAFLTALAFCSGASATQGFATQTSNQFAVTVKVTPRSLQGAVWEFDVVFDTHSQELKDDLLRTAVLLSADGTPVSPISWQGDPPGGHHRAGVLRFNALNPTPSPVVLRISRPGEPNPRSFQWVPK